MNAVNFDRLSRALSPGSTRRQVLGLLAGALPLAPLAASHDAEAKKKRRKRKNKNKNKNKQDQCSPACTGSRVCQQGECVCPSGTEECGGECRNACGAGRARNPFSCDCCNLGGGNCFSNSACCSYDCILMGAGICASRGPGDACQFDAQCSSGNCNGFCGN